MARKLNIDYIKAVISSFYNLQNTSTNYFPFKQLQTVRQRLDELNNTHITQSALLEYVVQRLLCDMIVSELTAHRGIFHQTDTRTLPVTRSQAIADIKEDLATQSVDLLGWSFVYHVYLRQDLSLSVEECAEIFAVHPRTLRRYKHRVCEQILQQLIDLEFKLQMAYS